MVPGLYLSRAVCMTKARVVGGPSLVAGEVLPAVAVLCLVDVGFFWGGAGGCQAPCGAFALVMWLGRRLLRTCVSGVHP